MPHFGHKIDGQKYQTRPGAYAVILDDSGRVAAVIDRGRLFLPGGGIEGSEKPEEALIREMREETGWQVVPGAEIGRAEEYMHVAEKDMYLNKQAVFFLTRIIEAGSSDSPTDHEVVWATPVDFAVKAAHESHVWAVNQALKPESI